VATEDLGFHSLHEETSASLAVEGDVPGWLSGTLIRNGPGAFGFGGREVDHWFDGLAMLRSFRFDGGGVEYRNRFLRTDALERARAGEFDGGFATGETTLRERLFGLLFGEPYDNANVIPERVGDRYLALTESPRWVEFDPRSLETRGDVRYDGDEPAGDLACAHVQRDPSTGAVINFETSFGRRNAYHVYEMRGPHDRQHVATVPVDRPAYMHSFAATDRYVVLPEFPFDVNPLSFLKPGRQGPFIGNFEWRPDAGTRLIVIDREAGEAVAEPVAGPTFGFHTVNAYESGADVVVDIETVPDPGGIAELDLEALRAGAPATAAGKIDRFRIADPRGSATVSRRELYEGGTALPRVSPAVRFEEYRYAYAQSTDQPMESWPSELVKVDVRTGETRTFGDENVDLSEPVFVPRPAGEAEDDGVVLAVGLDTAAAVSRLYVVDAAGMGELARATLPHALPYDFHGRFFAERG